MINRVTTLEDNVAELERMRGSLISHSSDLDKQQEWALRYGLLESVQIVIDISCHLVAKNNLGNAPTYNECVKLLGSFEYIDPKLVEKIIPMIGLRNLLVHEYVTIDINKLKSLLNELDDFKRFATQVREYL